MGRRGTTGIRGFFLPDSPEYVALNCSVCGAVGVEAHERRRTMRSRLVCKSAECIVGERLGGIAGCNV